MRLRNPSKAFKGYSFGYLLCIYQLYNKVNIVNMRSNKLKTKKYYVIHQSTGKLRCQTDHNNNIFAQFPPSIDFFPTHHSQNPFSLTETEEPKQYTSITSQQLTRNVKNSQSATFKLNTQTVYKLNKLPFSTVVQQLKKESRIINNNIKMPSINLKSNAIPVTQRNKSGSSAVMINVDKYNEKVDKYHYQHSIVNEIEFSKDLRSRCGEQYFQQILRDRHKDESKPLPYVYSLRSKIQPMQNSFVKFVKKEHPSIRLRQKMILKGINKSRIRTDESEKKMEMELKLQKLKVNLAPYGYKRQRNDPL